MIPIITAIAGIMARVITKTDTLCYYKCYGNLVFCVPHYQKAERKGRTIKDDPKLICQLKSTSSS